MLQLGLELFYAERTDGWTDGVPVVEISLAYLLDVGCLRSNTSSSQCFSAAQSQRGRDAPRRSVPPNVNGCRLPSFSVVAYYLRHITLYLYFLVNVRSGR